MILTGLSLLLNYCNYASYLLYNPHTVIKTRIDGYSVYFSCSTKW